MSLMRWFKGDGRREGRMRDTYIGPGEYPRGTGPAPGGVIVDGVFYRLDGVPDPPQSTGWGDMSWWFWRRERGLRLRAISATARGMR